MSGQPLFSNRDSAPNAWLTDENDAQNCLMMIRERPTRCRIGLFLFDRVEVSGALEPITILCGINEAVDHPAIVSGSVQCVDPLQIKSIGVSAQVSEVLHHDECLVEIVLENLLALDNRF